MHQLPLFARKSKDDDDDEIGGGGEDDCPVEEAEDGESSSPPVRLEALVVLSLPGPRLEAAVTFELARPFDTFGVIGRFVVLVVSLALPDVCE